MKMEEAVSSEKLVPNYQAARRHIRSSRHTIGNINMLPLISNGFCITLYNDNSKTADAIYYYKNYLDYNCVLYTYTLYFQPLQNQFFLRCYMFRLRTGRNQGDTMLRRHKQRIVRRQMVNIHTLGFYSS
jgi:hypothetical protein